MLPANFGTSCVPTPPPPLECTKGPHVYSHFLGKGGVLGRLSREDFPEKTQKRGFYGVFFTKLPEKWRKRGYDLYLHVSWGFNSLPRKGDRALIALQLCGIGPLEGSGKICTHISWAWRKEKKRKEREWGHHNFPEIERGWILCGKARQRVRQFSRDRECPVIGNTHR